jgi:uncharacterized integral membrane protein
MLFSAGFAESFVAFAASINLVILFASFINNQTVISFGYFSATDFHFP